MYISANGVDFIKGFEGLSLKAYKALPTEKYWTIGYGHYGADVSPGMVITEAQAEAMLTVDLGSYCRAVDQSVTFNKTQNQFDAMTSLCYNIGTGGFRGSTLVTKLNKGDVKGAADEFLKWTKSGGVVIQGLVTRRKKERALFLNGYGDVPVDPIDPTDPTNPNDPDDGGKGIVINNNNTLLIKMLLSDALHGWKR